MAVRRAGLPLDLHMGQHTEIRVGIVEEFPLAGGRRLVEGRSDERRIGEQAGEIGGGLLERRIQRLGLEACACVGAEIGKLIGHGSLPSVIEFWRRLYRSLLRSKSLSFVNTLLH